MGRDEPFVVAPQTKNVPAKGSQNTFVRIAIDSASSAAPNAAAAVTGGGVQVSSLPYGARPTSSPVTHEPEHDRQDEQQRDDGDGKGRPAPIEAREPGKRPAGSRPDA